MNCRWNEDRAPVSTIVQPLRQKAFFPLMPLPFEPLIHFNPNVFRQKRECKLYLCQCATVYYGCTTSFRIRLVALQFDVFAIIMYFFLSCLLILPQPLFTIYSFLSNKRSFIIAVCSVAVCLFFHVPYIFEERTKKIRKFTEASNF